MKVVQNRKFHETVNIFKKMETWEVSKSRIAIIWQERKFWKNNVLGKSDFSKRINLFWILEAARGTEIFKIFWKCDAWDMPVILEDDKFKIIICSVNFKSFKIIKIWRFLLIII
jgi:hypothetical protein